MAKKVKILTAADFKLLQQLLDAMRNGRLNIGPRQIAASYGEDQQSPDIYIALPQGGSGIPGLQRIGTAGSEFAAEAGDIPGSALCDIYRISSTGDLQPMGFSKTVFNFSEIAVGQDWIPVTRIKSGDWISTLNPQIAYGITQESIAINTRGLVELMSGSSSESLTPTGAYVSMHNKIQSVPISWNVYMVKMPWGWELLQSICPV